MSTNTKIAIVILNWNGQKLLEQFLPSVITYSEDALIYVADNASTDNSIAFLKEHYPQIGIIQNKTNGGFAKGYNDALRHVSKEADIYCLLNSDIEVTENWLQPVQELFKTDNDAAIVQPKILDYKQKDHFEYAGAGGGFLDMFGYPFCRGRIFQTLEKDDGQYNDIQEIFWATGACMFIKKETWDILNGFDEDYFAHQEEIDLCWRAQNRGFKIMYTGKSAVYHVGGATLAHMNPKKTFLNFRNSLYSITKNLPLAKAFPIILARLLLDGIAAIRFLFYFKFEHIIAILKAHLSYYANLPKAIKKRERQYTSKKYYKCTSIVWTYYVSNKKHYKSLVKH